MSKEKREDCIHNVKIKSGEKDIVIDKIYIEGYKNYRNIPPELAVAGASDFAIMLGADADRNRLQSATNQPCGDIILRSTLSQMDGYVDIARAGTASQGSTRVNDTSGLICPCMALPISAVQNNPDFGQFHVSTTGTPTVWFNKIVYPQKLADDQVAINNAFARGELVETGKVYSGAIRPDGSLKPLIEYEYNGKKYVSVAPMYDTEIRGMKLSKDDEYWVEVSPIVWNITNFDDLSTQINPRGTGRSNDILLRSQSGIISGLPFFPSREDNLYENEWQNSMIRAFLNGCSIHDQINHKNGLEKKKLPQNFDFRGRGFIDVMFDETTKTQTKAQTTTSAKESQQVYGYGVKISTEQQSVDDQIKFLIDKNMPFMLHGPSGVGKSRRIKELDPDCVMIQLRDGILPEEVIGKTAYENGTSTWLPPTWYTTLCDICAKEPNKNHVLFIDEITNVRPYEQSLVYNIVLEHSIDGNKGRLPSNCVVVAAGNSIFESDAAHNMPEPLYRRFYNHINLPINIESFVKWGSETNADGRPKVHPIVLAYIASHRDLISSKYDSEKPPKYALDPRGWEQVSDIIYDNDEVLSLDLIANKIGRENAIDFCNFAQTPLVTIDEIVSGKVDTKKIPRDFNAQRVLCLTLRVATEEQVPQVRNFIKKYLGAENLAYFDSVWSEGSAERTLLIGRLQGNLDINEHDLIYKE